jgi:Spy/CpxP family protein refolding chaperone
MNTAASSTPECNAEVLTRLHALLSPAERASLVDKVESHWEIWQQVNAEADGPGKVRGGRIAELTRELDLTPDQVERITSATSPGASGNRFDAKASEARLQAFCASFASASFDASTIQPNASGPMLGHGVRRMANFYEAVTPILTPAQRAKLADHLREHANHRQTYSSN